MDLYRYENYQEYVDAQVKANIKKINRVWVSPETIEQIHNIKPKANSIICHGTRNAKEQMYFKDFYPQANIIGTEISHTASQFPMTTQQDFHEQREEWINRFDILYSNAFDHSYDPYRAFKTWANQVTLNGIICVELMTGDDNLVKKSDPLKISKAEFLELAKMFGWLETSTVEVGNSFSKNKSDKGILCVLKRSS